jgi:hypothetical protein
MVTDGWCETGWVIPTNIPKLPELLRKAAAANNCTHACGFDFVLRWLYLRLIA